MKAVILAGGLGTRLSEETALRPKPMVEIGGKPIIWHIMKMYAQHDVTDFVICCGYKGYLIKEYFANYFLHMSDVTFNLQRNTIEVHHKRAEPWNITLVDTGDSSMTGGRLRRISSFVASDDAFCCTYGDGVSDVDITALISFHRGHGKLATLTATYPPARFGVLDIVDNQVKQFVEKPTSDGPLINGGFFVLSPKVLEYIPSDSTPWEQSPLQDISAAGELMAYEHRGFWQPMDTLRDKMYLESLWESGSAPWKSWK
jgi:glucose-1-phosphate cytidylyltransferase